MFVECIFDETKDIQPVVPELSIDLVVAGETGVVFDTGVEAFHNGLDDISGIGSRVRDAFEAVDAQRRLYRQSSQPSVSKTPVVNPEAGAGD